MDWLALYGAALASVLGLIRIIEYLSSRERIHFAMAYSTLVSGNPAETERSSFLAIHIGNRSSMPIELVGVGLLLGKGEKSRGIIFQQIRELVPFDTLPKRIEPTGGFTMGVLPEKLAETLGSRGVHALTHVTCSDASGRAYDRKLTKRDRAQIQTAIDDARAKRLQ